MKTTKAARRIVRARTILIGLGLAGILGAEVWLGQSLASRIGQVTASPTDLPQLSNPNVGPGDLFAAAR